MKGFLLVALLIVNICQLPAQQYELTKKDTSEVRFLNGRKFFIYKVDKGETLYSISKKFKIPQEEIKEFNQALAEEGLQPKMKLWIPSESRFLQKEKKEARQKEERPAEHRFNVAFFTALNIRGNISVDTSLADSSFVGDMLSRETITNLAFYEGALMALDSLNALHIKVHFFLYDTENDSSRTAELLRKPEMKKMNALLSNGNTVISKLFNQYSVKNEIVFLSATANSSELMHDNKNAVALLPSSLTQCYEMGRTAAKKFSSYNCLLMKTPVVKENDRTNAFRKGWMEESKEHLKVVDYTNDFQKAIVAMKDSLVRKQNNLFFVSSGNEDFVSRLVNALKEYSEEYRMTVIGLPTWQYFETIDPLLLELLDVHLFTSSFINYNQPATGNFIRNFFSNYKTEPEEAAFEGFDMMMLAGKEILPQEKKTFSALEKKMINGFFTTYFFEKPADDSFLENHCIILCRYQNYELKRVSE